MMLRHIKTGRCLFSFLPEALPHVLPSPAWPVRTQQAQQLRGNGLIFQSFFLRNGGSWGAELICKPACRETQVSLGGGDHGGLCPGT